MVSPCIVHLCKNIGTHRFPKIESRRTEWIRAVRHTKPGLTIRTNSLICSAHFLRTDFAITPTHLAKLDCATRPPKILKKTAVPSVFPWTQASEQQNDAFQEPTTSHTSSTALIFDPSKAQATYSRTPPVAFVEMLLLDTQAETDIAEDPLQQSNDEEEFQETELQGIIENDIAENPPLYYLDEDDYTTEIEIYAKSVGTQTQVDQVNLQLPHVISVDTQTEGPRRTHGFSIYEYTDDDQAIKFYTGLENFEKLMLVFYSLGKSVYNLIYFYGPPPEKTDALEQFFITLIILRRHKTFEEMTMLYKIALKQVYTIFITWIRFMSLQWKNLDLWIDRENVKAYMPLDFNDKYPATRTILDATECPIKKPKLPLAQQITFSSYKNRNTVKTLIGITPGGMINYVSPAYGGSATDRQIIERSPILNRFEYNDEIMVDKGFNVQDIFVSYGVKVNMPAFFRKGNQIGSDTLACNRRVASKRVHVERVIGMLKTYKILVEPMNQTEILLSSDIILIISMLVNFRSNIIN